VGLTSEMPLPSTGRRLQNRAAVLKGLRWIFLREMFPKERVVACKAVNYKNDKRPRQLRRRGAGADSGCGGQRREVAWFQDLMMKPHRQLVVWAEGDVSTTA